MIFIKGFLAGLGLIVLVGPVLIVLLETTIVSGKKEGLSVATGIFASDVIAVAMCLLGLQSLINNNKFLMAMFLAGGSIFITLGIISFFRSVSINQSIEKNVLRSFLKGFSVNFFNPFVFLVWISMITALSRWLTYSEVIIFMSGAVTGVFFLDITKVFLASYLKRFLSDGIIKVSYKISGIILLIAGISSISSGLKLLNLF